MTEHNRLTGFPRSSSTRIAARAPQNGQANAKLETFDTVKRQTIRCGELEIVTETWSSSEVASASSFSGEQNETSRPLASPGKKQPAQEQETPLLCQPKESLEKTIQNSRSAVNQLNQMLDKTSQKPKQSFNRSSRSVRQSPYQSSDRPNRPVTHQHEQSYKSRSVKELRQIFENNS